MAFYAIDPWSPERGDLQSAIVAATVANTAPFRKSSQRFEVKDFMPYQEQRPKRMTDAELRNAVERIVKFQNQIIGAS